MINKQKLPLIIGLTIPIVMILVLGGIVYIPSLFVHPQHDFLYTNNDDYYSGQEYSVVNGKLVVRPLTAEELKFRGTATPPEPKYYVHDVKTNSSREITLAAAQKLNLDSNHISDDGYEIVRGGYGGDIFPFFYGSSDYDSYYLRGHRVNKKLNLQQVGYRGYYYYQFNFLGWIK